MIPMDQVLEFVHVMGYVLLAVYYTFSFFA